MDTKVRATRAVITVLVRRAVQFWTFIAFGLFALIFAICWALATYVSPWWWLLLIAYLPLLAFALLVRVIIGFFLESLFCTRDLSKPQRLAVNAFVDKIQRLLEARGMGLWVFTLLSFKDILFHRDLRTARHTLDDATSFHKDFAELEKLFI